jgi:hypothetical protein
MDGQHMDRIARSLASGMSRRGVMKTVAAAVGFAAVGARSAPTAAAARFRVCVYECIPNVAYATRCKSNCEPGDTVRQDGLVCNYVGVGSGVYDSRKTCLSNID